MHDQSTSWNTRHFIHYLPSSRIADPNHTLQSHISSNRLDSVSRMGEELPTMVNGGYGDRLWIVGNIGE